MSTVLVLIADRAKGPIDLALLREVQAVTRGTVDWLDEGYAVDVSLPAAVDPARTRRLDALLEGKPIDRAILLAAGRRKRLLLSDMDSTMITIECIDELADLIGIKAEIAAVTAKAMNGELEFAHALTQRVALLAGLEVSVIQEVIEARVRPMPGAGTLVATMRANGATTALVSGGFTAFTGHVRAALGFDVDEANVLEVRDGRLTGKLVPPIRDAQSKLAALHRLAAERGIALIDTLAVGDGANDLPMIKAAGLGVGFRPHPRVRAEAPVTIAHGDLTSLLFLQGYRRAELVEG